MAAQNTGFPVSVNRKNCSDGYRQPCNRSAMATLGERVKSVRKERKLSQTALAKKVGVKYQTIQDLEYNTSLGSKHILALARALGVRPEWLETGKGPRSTEASDVPLGVSKAYTPTNQRVALPVELPSEAQLTAMFASMLEMAGRPDPKDELAQTLAQSFPGVLAQTLAESAQNRLVSTNAPDATAQPRAKRRVEHRRRART